MAEDKTEFIPGTIYHVYSHANGKDILFKNDYDYNLFLKKYHKYLDGVAETFAYCLMPNHFHFMIRIKDEADILKFIAAHKPNVLKKDVTCSAVISAVISRQFGHLLNSHAQWFNKRYDRMGSLFIPSIERIAVTTDSYISTLFAYIHNNPVHHGFCKNILDWPYSSIHAYLDNKSTKLNKGFMEKWFGSKDALIRFYQEKLAYKPLKLTL